MTKVKILYDEVDFFENIESAKDKVEENRNINIRITYTSPYEILDKLRTNPNYDIVILHLGTDEGRAYELADRIRRLSNTYLVAESSSFPHDKDEVLRHFDKYIPMVQPWNLEHLLKEQGFIAEGEKNDRKTISRNL